MLLEALRAEGGEGGEGWRAPATADMVSLQSLRDKTRALAMHDYTSSSMCEGGGEGRRSGGVSPCRKHRASAEARKQPSVATCLPREARWLRRLP